MPASTSPYQSNDYQSVSNYRPYALPVNDIFKAITAQNAWWEEGASRVKSVYDNALDLQLSKPGNQKIRDDFMKQADQQLTKLSSMDLADPSVQRQGFNIFKPLFKDEGIVYDDAATKHYEQVRSDALAQRQKGDGKGYSDTNLQYAMTGYKEFMDSPDRMAGKKAYVNRREYTPYYDPTPDMNTALKNCHPDTYTKDTGAGLDIVHQSNEGLSAIKLNGCLGSISPKAMRQLQIDGAVTYKNNLGALRDGYLPHLDNTIKQLSEESAAYQGFLANKDNLETLTDEQLKPYGLSKATLKTLGPQVVALAQGKVSDNQHRIDNLQKTADQLRAGDLSSISGDNFEQVAGSVYTKGYMDQYSASHQWFKNTDEIKPWISQDLIYKEDREDNRLRMTIEGERQRELIKGYFKNGKLQTSNDLTDNRAIQSAFTATPGNDYNQITHDRNVIAGQKGQLNSWYLAELKRMGMPDDMEQHWKAHDQTYQNWYSNFVSSTPKESPNMESIVEYQKKMERLSLQEELMRNTQDTIDAHIQKTNPQLFGTDHLKDISTISVKGQTITPQEVVAALQGGSQILQIQEPKNIRGVKTGGHTRYILNGKDVGDIDAPSNHALRDIVSRVGTAEGSRLDKLMSLRNDLAKTNTIVQKEGYTFAGLDAVDEKHDFKKQVLQNVGLSENAKDAITIGQTDLRGGLEVTIHDPSATSPKWDKKDVLEQFRQRYGVTAELQPIKGDKYHFIISGIEGLNKFTSPEVQIGELMAPYVRSLEKQVTNPGVTRTTGLLRSEKDISKQFGMTVTAGSDPGTYRYSIYDNTGKTIKNVRNREDALTTLNYFLSNDYANKRLEDILSNPLGQ